MAHQAHFYNCSIPICNTSSMLSGNIRNNLFSFNYIFCHLLENHFHSYTIVRGMPTIISVTIAMVE